MRKDITNRKDNNLNFDKQKNIILGVVLDYDPVTHSVLVISESAEFYNGGIPDVLGEKTYIQIQESPLHTAATHGRPRMGDIVEIVYSGVDPSRGWVRFVKKLVSDELDATESYDIEYESGGLPF